MKALLLATLIAALRAYIGGGVYDRIAKLVTFLLGSDIPGQEKMDYVVKTIKAETSELSTQIIRAAAEIILLKVRQ